MPPVLLEFCVVMHKFPFIDQSIMILAFSMKRGEQEKKGDSNGISVLLVTASAI